jgi:cytoskeletal protein RodZ
MSDSVGEQLRNARQERNLSLEQVARATHMRVHYLQALESDQLEAIPSQAQARGFLRAYAEYLELDVNQVLQAMPGMLPATVEPSSKPVPRSAPPIPAGLPDPDLIFKEIGHTLQTRRELLGINLEEVARQTHLRLHYLQALEDGNLAGLPSPVQGRGMLNNYAVFLGMDPEPLMLRFAEVLQAGLTVRQMAQSETPTRPARPRPEPVTQPVRQRRFSLDLLLGIFLVVFLGGFIVWGAIRIYALRNEDDPEATAPSIADVLLATPSPDTTQAPKAITATVTVPVTINNSTVISGTQSLQTTPLAGEIGLAGEGSLPVQVYVTVRQRAWLRALVDGELQFEGRVLPGSAYTFAGSGTVELLTSNGAGLQVFFNQQDLGLLGEIGQIVNRIFTREGILQPTPTNTPEATPTVPVNLTPTSTLPPGAFPIPAGP